MHICQPTTYIIHMDSCIQIPTCHLHTPLTHSSYSYTLLLPQHPHTNTQIETWHILQGKTAVGSESTLRAEVEARAGWVTSHWYVRKEQDSNWAREPIASAEHNPLASPLLPFDFWFTELQIHYISANRREEAHWAVMQSGREDQGSCWSGTIENAAWV